MFCHKTPVQISLGIHLPQIAYFVFFYFFLLFWSKTSDFYFMKNQNAKYHNLLYSYCSPLALFFAIQINCMKRRDSCNKCWIGIVTFNMEIAPNFTLIWFLLNSFGKSCFKRESYKQMKKIQILKILRAPSI